MLSEESSIDLPRPPADQAPLPVKAWSEPIEIDTYEPAAPDRYPQFLDNRVYQGSSGKVFPLPFHERIASEKHPHLWQAVHLENEWMRVVILPELGGRIHIAYDKSTDYDIFYRNNVIKPALVGLTGPWISGGVEFNWPQHHRPATYLPTDVSIERDDDGSVTVWCSDHDPFDRMKGMHGIRLRPDSSAVEARVRLFNRSEQTRTFLWWANVAAAVGDGYQSFFPGDVHHVADHAKRAVVTFPQVEGLYYGVDYPSRVDSEHPDADRLDWYRNIPVPTSYMVTASEDSFFGGYDHSRQAGFVHWADRSIAPGKKQWTWGNAPFGHAWDANLTDTDGPYVELMAGVFTDNQPDFSFLAPGETKTFSQFWYPISEIGPAMQATREAAIRVDVVDAATLRVGVSPSVPAPGSTIEFVGADGSVLGRLVRDLAPGAPVVVDWTSPQPVDLTTVRVRVEHDGTVLVEHSWRAADDEATAPAPAVAPPAPAEVETVEELHLIATYLQQYRHATRSPEPYWAEALARDASDVRSNVALGSLRYEEARYDEAIAHFRRAIARETLWAPNPGDGEAHYRLGLALRRAGREDEARAAWGKATWNAAQAIPAHLALARSLAVVDPANALDHARQVVRRDAEHLQGRDVVTVLLRRLGREEEAEQVLRETLAIDPLDHWARDLAGLAPTSDAPTLLDVALEYRSVGDDAAAQRLFDAAVDAAPRRAPGQVNVGPLATFHAAALDLAHGDEAAARARIARATDDATNSLPSRLDDVDALVRIAAFDSEPVVGAMLGSWYFARGRYADAIDAWTTALHETVGRERTSGAPLRALLERNLGIAAYNVQHDPESAAAHFEAARLAMPDDARLLFESDQLAARRGVDSSDRLRILEERLDLVQERDDLSVERARLLTREGRSQEALEALRARRFQPWEGGEGVVLSVWDAVALDLARLALADDDPAEAIAFVSSALHPPRSLGEARHPLATTADLHLALGDALDRAGRTDEAREAWETAARAQGDFSDMATAAFTERSVAAISALRRLGQAAEADSATAALAQWIDEEAARPAEIDFFATSLPTLLLFHDDPAVERDRRLDRLRALHGDLVAEAASSAL